MFVNSDSTEDSAQFLQYLFVYTSLLTVKQSKDQQDMECSAEPKVAQEQAFETAFLRWRLVPAHYQVDGLAYEQERYLPPALRVSSTPVCPRPPVVFTGAIVGHTARVAGLNAQ